jgi:hypothetical protein
MMMSAGGKRRPPLFHERGSGRLVNLDSMTKAAGFLDGVS